MHGTSKAEIKRRLLQRWNLHGQLGIDIHVHKVAQEWPNHGREATESSALLFGSLRAS